MWCTAEFIELSDAEAYVYWLRGRGYTVYQPSLNRFSDRWEVESSKLLAIKPSYIV